MPSPPYTPQASVSVACDTCVHWMYINLRLFLSICTLIIPLPFDSTGVRITLRDRKQQNCNGLSDISRRFETGQWIWQQNCTFEIGSGFAFGL